MIKSNQSESRSSKNPNRTGRSLHNCGCRIVKNPRTACTYLSFSQLIHAPCLRNRERERERERERKTQRQRKSVCLQLPGASEGDHELHRGATMERLLQAGSQLREDELRRFATKIRAHILRLGGVRLQIETRHLPLPEVCGAIFGSINLVVTEILGLW